MKILRKFQTILIYLLQPEDTTAGAVGGWKTAHGGITRLGPLKAVFWCLIAIAMPICVALINR